MSWVRLLHSFFTVISLKIEEEIKASLDFLGHIYSKFGFDFSTELSTRPENFIGDLASWEHAESQLSNALIQQNLAFNINPADGAFYGPKIDIKLKDGLDRTHQCATIQLDFQLPNRFGLEYINSEKESVRPVLIHRALFGSLERFFAILLEHYEGKWPFFISPRQLTIIPVVQEEQLIQYSKEIQRKLQSYPGKLFPYATQRSQFDIASFFQMAPFM